MDGGRQGRIGGSLGKVPAVLLSEAVNSRRGETTMASSSTVEEAGPRVKSAFAASPVHDLREVQVENHESGLLLLGRVSSFYHKQLAQELARNVAGEVIVVNAIDVA
jgi:hypothetical protein